MKKTTWTLQFLDDAKKQMKKLDRQVQKRVLTFFYHRVFNQPNPRQFAKLLTGDWAGYWSFRIGDYRAICDIREDELVILVIEIDHRRQVYDS